MKAPAPCRATGGDSSLVSHFSSSSCPTFQAPSMTVQPRARRLPSLCLQFLLHKIQKRKKKKKTTLKCLLAPTYCPLPTPFKLQVIHPFIHLFTQQIFTECQLPAKSGLDQGINTWGEFILYELHKCIISGENFSFLTSKDVCSDPQAPVLSSRPQSGGASCFYLFI